VRDGDIREYDIKPDDLGIVQHSLDAIGGGDAAENAHIARRVLEGELGARRETVVANAGAALYVSDAAPTLREGVELARQSIDSGRALKKLEELIAVTRELA
jgi:anthranilate phosphoribosyltransferase